MFITMLTTGDNLIEFRQNHDCEKMFHAKISSEKEIFVRQRNQTRYEYIRFDYVLSYTYDLFGQKIKSPWSHVMKFHIIFMLI